MDSPIKQSHKTSPEFEFWTENNATSPLPSADELFVNGVILPLHLLHLHPKHNPDPETKPEQAEPDPEPKPEMGPDRTSSKRWKDIFKKGEKKKSVERTGAELNINIWPFSRSRSDRTGATRSKPTNQTRKISSAPCSRSNSAGESKSRKWPSSPGRVGVHLGRASPVWQVPRTKQKKQVSGGGAKPRVLNLNVPMCIGYGNHVGCRSEESGAVAVADVEGGGDGTRGSNMFNFRSLFGKKVVY